MAQGLRFALDSIADGFEEAMRRKHEPVARAATAAIQDAADLFKTEARANIIAAGLGRKFAGALRVKTFPRSGAPSIDAAVYAYSKIPYAGVFEEGATIKGRPYLWLPLDNAPKGRGGRRIPPSEYRAKIGHPLYSLRRPGKAPILFANVRLSSRSRGVSQRALKRGRNPGGRGKLVAVPLYVGVKSVDIDKKIDTGGVAARVRSRLPGLYLKHFVDR